MCVRVFAKDKDTSDQKSHFVFLFVLVINVKKRFNACKVWEQPSFCIIYKDNRLEKLNDSRVSFSKAFKEGLGEEYVEEDDIDELSVGFALGPSSKGFW